MMSHFQNYCGTQLGYILKYFYAYIPISYIFKYSHSLYSLLIRKGGKAYSNINLYRIPDRTK